MATPASSSAQAAQTGLVIALGYDLERAFNTLDLSSLQDSLPRFFALIAALVHRYGSASATLAARYYTAERAAAKVSAPFRVAPAPLPPMEQIGASVGWATMPLRADGDLATTESNVRGVADRLVLDVGRRTLVDAVQRDRQAKGWARVTRPGACSFCRLLATRGAVYKTESTAGRDANARFAGEGEFKFHNHCHCYVEPVFGTYEMTAQARDDLALYKEVTKGRSGADARAAFRQAVEGRTPTGTTGRTTEEAATPRRITTDPETARRLIGQFEQSIQTMTARGGLDKAIEAARKRIAELQAAL